jgi:hypothetical protein
VPIEAEALDEVPLVRRLVPAECRDEPLGVGEGASSIGPREQGRAAREVSTSTHTIAVSPTP